METLLEEGEVEGGGAINMEAWIFIQICSQDYLLVHVHVHVHVHVGVAVIEWECNQRAGATCMLHLTTSLHSDTVLALKTVNTGSRHPYKVEWEMGMDLRDIDRMEYNHLAYKQ